MDLGITGKNALVLGGAGGLGRAIALALGREGANVAIADIDETSLADAQTAVAATGAQTLALTWSLSDLTVVEERITAVEAGLGPIDILVAITGGPPPTPAAGQDLSLWQAQFQSMVLPVIAIADRVLPGMRDRKWGRIVTSSSSGIVAPIPSLGLSNSLRMSLLGWSKTLAREVAADGVTANVIVPGRIATKRIRQLDQAKADREARTVEAVMAESVGTIPMQRYGEPEEYADMVCFLASERAAYVTGSVVRVDGGLIPSV